MPGRCGGTGRHAGFRFLCPHGRAGSSPVTGTRVRHSPLPLTFVDLWPRIDGKRATTPQNCCSFTGSPRYELSTDSKFLAAAAAIYVQCEAMYALTSTLSRFDRLPFTASYAIENGITRKTLRGPQYRRLFRGVYIRSDVELDRRIWLRAARLVLPPDAVVSHHSAAWLYGFDARAGRRLEFSTNSRTTTDHDGVILHRRQSTIVPYTVDSMPVTGPDRTFVDCCHRLGFVTCVQLADHLINVGATNMATLIDYASTRHFHGVRRARRIVMYASERAESPRETLVRLMLRFARLPAVSVNLPVDAAGSARADLMF